WAGFEPGLGKYCHDRENYWLVGGGGGQNAGRAHGARDSQFARNARPLIPTATRPLIPKNSYPANQISTPPNTAHTRCKSFSSISALSQKPSHSNVPHSGQQHLIKQ